MHTSTCSIKTCNKTVKYKYFKVMALVPRTPGYRPNYGSGDHKMSVWVSLRLGHTMTRRMEIRWGGGGGGGGGGGENVSWTSLY